MGFKKSENRVTISFSEVTTYLRCAFQHNLKYIQGLKEPESIILVYGKSMHLALQALYSMPLDMAIALFQKDLEDGCSKLDPKPMPETIVDYFNNGKVLITAYHKTPYMKMENRGIEIDLEQKIIGDKIFFKGFIDLLLYDQKRKKYIIIDYKTTNNGWTNSVKNDKVKRAQLLLYKYFVLNNKRSLGEDIKDEDIECLFILLQGKKKTLDYVHVEATEEQCKKAYRFLVEVVKKIYVEKKIKYKNSGGCYFCYWNYSPECDKVNKQADLVNIQEIVDIMI